MTFFNQDQIVWTLMMIEGILGVILGMSGVLGPEASKWVTLVHAVVSFVAAFCRQSPFPKTKWTAEERSAYVAANPK